MKKRKPPVVLATCLVILLISVGIFFAPQGSGEIHQEQVAQQPVDRQARPTVSSNEVSSMATAAMKEQKMTPAKPGGGNSGPSVIVPKPVSTKPKPTESSTSTQWYIDQTKK